MDKVLNGKKVIFKKQRYYQGILHEVGDIVLMEKKDIKAYIDVFAIDYYFDNLHKKYEDMTYKDLQQLCKNKNIPAVGKKEELINAITNKVS